MGRSVTWMRWALVLGLAVPSCSLDLERLRSGVDGGGTDSGALDGGDGLDAPADANGTSDASDADIPGPLLSLTIRSNIDLGAPIQFIDASERRVVATSGTKAVFLTVMGTRCSLELALDLEESGTFGPVALGNIDGMAGVDGVMDAGMSNVATFLNDEPSMGGLTHSHPEVAALDLGRFSADPLDDILVVGATTGASVYLGNGSGMFTGLLSTGAEAGSTTLDGAFGDVDGDDVQDVIRLISTATGVEVNYVRGNRTGLFGPASWPADPSASRLAVGSWNGAGAESVLVVAGRHLQEFGRTLDGGLGRRSDLSVIGALRDVVFAEIDPSNGVREAVATNSASLTVFTNESGSPMVLGSLPLDGTTGELASFDADGDGADELVVVVGTQVLLLTTGCP